MYIKVDCIKSSLEKKVPEDFKKLGKKVNGGRSLLSQTLQYTVNKTTHIEAQLL
jgi:hypothetical protein